MDLLAALQGLNRPEEETSKEVTLSTDAASVEITREQFEATKASDKIAANNTELSMAGVVADNEDDLPTPKRIRTLNLKQPKAVTGDALELRAERTPGAKASGELSVDEQRIWKSFFKRGRS